MPARRTIPSWSGPSSKVLRLLLFSLFFVFFCLFNLFFLELGLVQAQRFFGSSFSPFFFCLFPSFFLFFFGLGLDQAHRFLGCFFCFVVTIKLDILVPTVRYFSTKVRLESSLVSEDLACPRTLVA